MSEAARARSASESGTFGSVRAWQRSRRRLRPDEAIVALNQFEDELAVWVIKPRQRRLSRCARCRAQTSQRLVARQQHEIWQRGGRRTAPAATSTTRSCGRCRHRLTGVTRLVVRARCDLQNVAFAALYNASRSRFLVEDVSRADGAECRRVRRGSGEHRAARGSTWLKPLDFQRSDAPDGAADCARSYRTERRARRTERHPASGSSPTRPAAASCTSRPARRQRQLIHCCRGCVVADEPGSRHSGAILGSEIAAAHVPRHRPGRDRRSRAVHHPIEARAR